MKKGRDYTAPERALILMGVLAGRSLADINEALILAQIKLGSTTRELNPSSYNMLKEHYAPVLMKDTLADGVNSEHDFENAWSHCLSPMTISQLREVTR